MHHSHVAPVPAMYHSTTTDLMAPVGSTEDFPVQAAMASENSPVMDSPAPEISSAKELVNLLVPAMMPSGNSPETSPVMNLPAPEISSVKE